MTEDTPGPLLRVEGVSKHYGGVRALEDVQFSCRAGTIHALLGENGAGKSTFIKILSGVVQPDRGRIFLDGAPVSFATPAAAAQAGISCIFQELSLLPDLTVADNIGIAHPPRRFGSSIVQRSGDGRRRCSRASAATISIRRRRSVNYRCRASKWWKSPRRSRASRRC